MTTFSNHNYTKRNAVYLIFTVFLLLIFIRWAVVLHQKNIDAYQDKLALYNLIIDIDNSVTTLELYEQEVELLKIQFQRQTNQLLIEAGLFFLLLILGIGRMFIYFKKEIDLVNQQRNFLLSITHELKSPLASALLNVQTLLKHPVLEKDKQIKLLENSDDELLRLQKLVERLLLSAKLEEEVIQLNKEEVKISVLFNHLWQHYKVQYEKTFQFNETIQEDIKTVGDKVLLSSVFTNIMDNAIKHTDLKGKIELTIKHVKKNIFVSIFNEGNSIPVEEQSKIWNKFYRMGDERTRENKGTGLGLHITKEIVKAHNGKVSIHNAEKGVIFKIILPNYDN